MLYFPASPRQANHSRDTRAAISAGGKSLGTNIDARILFVTTPVKKLNFTVGRNPGTLGIRRRIDFKLTISFAINFVAMTAYEIGESSRLVLIN